MTRASKRELERRLEELEADAAEEDKVNLTDLLLDDGGEDGEGSV